MDRESANEVFRFPNQSEQLLALRTGKSDARRRTIAESGIGLASF